MYESEAVLSQNTSYAGLTPLMQQYMMIKDQYSDALVFFQVGDFYELFFDDAQRASAYLGIALTKRGTHNGEPIPLCGVPVHALDHHLNKLIRGGFKVVLCDQQEEAQPGKLVRRAVSQVLTPGTLTDTKLLDEKKSSYILFYEKEQNNHVLLFVEILTGTLFVTNVHEQKNVEAELARFSPDEIVVHVEHASLITFLKQRGFVVSLSPYASADEVASWMQQHETMRGSGYEASKAFCLLYAYLTKNNPHILTQLQTCYTYKSDDYLLLDSATQRNLELVCNAHDGSKKNTLFSVLDRAVTSMGSRMIRSWLVRPLLDQRRIEERLDAVAQLVDSLTLRQELAEHLRHIADMERIVGRIALGRAQLHDYIRLAETLTILPSLRVLIAPLQQPLFKQLYASLLDDTRLCLLLRAALNDDASHDWLIKKGYDDRLDRMRSLVLDAQKTILELEQQEIETTGISSLKIRFNDIVGYYIEVTKTNVDLVPDHYIRLQTLAQRERYTTAQLKALQADIERAKREVGAVEQELYARIKEEVSGYVPLLRKTAHALARLDALLGFATIAYEQGYVRPTFTDHIKFKQARHPVVASMVDHFIANDTMLHEQERVWIITGPNMGGKSTYLRQVALLTLMAQCGSFVPAAQAECKIVDRIFTRIGAGDNVAEGKSTFLVEMEETATICTQATKQSLVILDEVGRGTSTYDGFALAQAIIEHLYTKVGAYCLFATHYHELTSLVDEYNGIVAYHATSKQTEHGIIFLHTIERGCAPGSFGLEVARLAHIPDSIIERARSILISLSHNKKDVVSADVMSQQPTMKDEQLRRLKDAIEALKLESMTPKMAFDFLWSLKEDSEIF